MVPNVRFILLVFSFVLFAIAAIWYSAPEPNRMRLVAAGLACVSAAFIFG